MFISRFMPCSHCGESVERGHTAEHRCDPERRIDYAMFGLRTDIASFEFRVRQYLDTSRGRFEVWLAARDIRDSLG